MEKLWAFKRINHLLDDHVECTKGIDEFAADEETIVDDFCFLDVFAPSVFRPFLVILLLMFIQQFSGQGAITFYTAQIFQVSIITFSFLNIYR